jgi:hypothetical protein
MRLRWLACGAFFFGLLGCGSSPDGSALELSKQCPTGASCPAGTGGISESGGAGGAGIGAGGILPFGGSGGAAGSSTGGDAGFFNTGGYSFSTGGVAGLPDGSIGSGGDGGSTGTCPVGHFSGSYEGTYGSLLLGMNPVSGDIEFTIDSSGSVTGTYTGRNPNNNSKADLVGTLDCSTFELSMNVENGTYQLLGMVRFSGTMPGKYSPETRSFTGTWSLSDANSQSGKGTWTAQ